MYLNQAFLGLQFFQVQGRSRAFAVIRMNHYISSFSASIQIFSRKDNRLRYSFDVRNRFAVVNSQFSDVLEQKVLFFFFVYLVKIIQQTTDFCLYFLTGLCNICYCNYYDKKEMNTLLL